MGRSQGFGGIMDSEALKQQGESLMAEQRVAEAAALFAQAADLAPGDEGAWIRLGIAHSVLGHKEQALAAFDRALALNPHSVTVYYNRSGMKRYGDNDPEFALLQDVLAQGDAVPLQQQIMAHFTLGKAWMDVGDGAQAFHHFHLGNGLMRRTRVYDVQADIALMQQVPSILTAERIAALKGGGNPSTRPIFVVGMPRSGSTLVEQILASHPQVAGGGEIVVFRHLVQNVRDGDGRSIPYPLLAGLVPPDLMGAIGQGYLSLTERWAEPGKDRLVDKFLENFIYAGLIHAALPQAKIIHCRRNAMDTCLSCYTMMFGGAQDFTFDLEELGRYWLAYDQLMAHWRSVLPPEHFIEVDYEDMVTDMPATTRALLERLDLPWDDGCLAFHTNQRPVLTASSQQVRQPVHTASMGRWKSFALYLEPLMRVLGITS